MLCREVIDFGKIAVEVKQLPFVVLERRARRMIGDRLPAVVPEPAMPEHLEILRLRILTAPMASAIERAKLSPSIGICAVPRDLRGRADPDQFEQGRRQIAGVDELVPQLAPGRDALRP